MFIPYVQFSGCWESESVNIFATRWFVIKYQAWEPVLGKWISMTMWNGKWRTGGRQSVLLLHGSLVRKIKLLCFLSESIHATSSRPIHKNQCIMFGLVDYGFACLSRTWYWNWSPEISLKTHTHIHSWSCTVYFKFVLLQHWKT